MLMMSAFLLWGCSSPSYDMSQGKATRGIAATAALNAKSNSSVCHNETMSGGVRRWDGMNRRPLGRTDIGVSLLREVLKPGIPYLAGIL
jgi:hypothetical protein